MSLFSNRYMQRVFSLLCFAFSPRLALVTALGLGGIGGGHRLGAQNHEIGIGAGGTNFIGDVGDYGIHMPKGWYAGGLYRITYQQYFALRLSGAIGTIENRDEWSSYSERVNRNLSFRSQIWESSLVLEFNFFRFDPRSTLYNKTFYVYGGVGVVGFNPEAEYEGVWYELQPLSTEGQNTTFGKTARYNLIAMTYPFGFGFKYAPSRRVQLFAEFGGRSTSSDYLDDVGGRYANPDLLAFEMGEVSAALSDRSLVEANRKGLDRGNPNNDDWYFFTGVGIVWRFTDKAEKCAKFWGR